jgi:hypothetical protein
LFCIAAGNKKTTAASNDEEDVENEEDEEDEDIPRSTTVSVAQKHNDDMLNILNTLVKSSENMANVVDMLGKRLVEICSYLFYCHSCRYFIASDPQIL